MGFAPTGKVYEDTAIVIHRISEGKIVEECAREAALQC